MNSLDTTLVSNENIATKEETNKNDLTKDDFSFFAHFDITLVRILHRFYGSATNPINGDINCYTVYQLQQLLSKEGLKVTIGGLRKKLEFLVRVGFLEKVTTYPRVYMPVKDINSIERIQKKISRLREIFL